MNKTILITGGEGFVAHHVIDTLLKKTNWNIISLDQQYIKNHNRLDYILSKYDDSIKNRIKRIYCTTKSARNFIKFLDQNCNNINYILHFAALADVDDSIKNPLKTIKTNVNITLNILEYARKLKNLERFIHISTEAVFGPINIGESHKEYDRYNSINPYAASKASTEEISIAYANSYNIPICITRLMNQIGERSRGNQFLDIIIRKLQNNQEIIIHGDTQNNTFNTNKYLHSSEVGNALLFILNLDLSNIEINDPYKIHQVHKFNIAPDESINTLEFAKLVSTTMKKDLRYKIEKPISGRPKYVSLDGSSLKKLGWRTSKSLNESITQIVNWYMENPEWMM